MQGSRLPDEDLTTRPKALDKQAKLTENQIVHVSR